MAKERVKAKAKAAAKSRGAAGARAMKRPAQVRLAWSLYAFKCLKRAFRISFSLLFRGFCFVFL